MTIDMSDVDVNPEIVDKLVPIFKRLKKYLSEEELTLIQRSFPYELLSARNRAYWDEYWDDQEQLQEQLLKENN